MVIIGLNLTQSAPNKNIFVNDMSTKQNNITDKVKIEIEGNFCKRSFLCGHLWWSLNTKIVIIGLSVP